MLSIILLKFKTVCRFNCNSMETLRNYFERYLFIHPISHKRGGENLWNLKRLKKAESLRGLYTERNVKFPCLPILFFFLPQVFYRNYIECIKNSRIGWPEKYFRPTVLNES